MIRKDLKALFSRFGIILVACASVGFGLSSPAGSDGRPSSLRALKRQDIARHRIYRSLSLKPQPVGSVKKITGASLPVDKDDDGMPDSWETANGFNVNDPNDAWLDADKDGVVNLFECQLGSDPNDASTPPIVTVGTSDMVDYTDLEEALDSAADGSCIRVAKGTYFVNYMTFIPKVIMIQGGWNADFTVRNLKTNPTVLDGSKKDDDEVLYFSFASGNSAVILDGLKITKGAGGFGAVNLLAQTTAFLKASIFNCLIVKSKSDDEYGSVLSFCNWDSSLSDRTIANTVIGTNTASGIYAQITDYSKSRWRILHSAIAKNTNGGGENGYGIEVFTQGTASLKTHIFNSILWGNEQEDLNIRWTGLTFKVDHTDIGRVQAEYGAKYVKGAGNLNKDPKFMGPASANYHLKATSPAINKGIKKGMPVTDFEGDKRVKGALPDMGPDER